MGKKAGPPPLLPRPPACLALFAKENADAADRGKVVEEEAKAIQRRLREQLTQLWDENATFQRLMYKNRNQHRRAIYFRRLMQVRRDLLLLQSLGLSDAVDTLVQLVTPGKPKTAPAKAASGNSMVRGSEFKDRQRNTMLGRLLGAARLLQQMADPILNASSQIASLLSQSFFMPFALTMLALLARFRVLLLQVLYEVVASFNLVAADLQHVQKVVGKGDLPDLLECRWDGVKFTIHEKMPSLPPPRSPEELEPLPTFVSDVTPLPEVGWFIDDRSTISKKKLQHAETGPVLYVREEGFLLGSSPFELCETEEATNTTHSPMDTDATQRPSQNPTDEGNEIPRPDSVAQLDPEGEIKSDILNQVTAAKGNLPESTVLKRKLSEVSSSSGEPSLSEDTSLKKRVAYVSVQLGTSKAKTSFSSRDLRSHGSDVHCQTASRSFTRVQCNTSTPKGSPHVLPTAQEVLTETHDTSDFDTQVVAETTHDISGLSSLEKVEQIEGTAGNGDMDAKSGRETVIVAHQADVSVTEEGFNAHVDRPFEDAVPMDIPNDVTNILGHPSGFKTTDCDTQVVAEMTYDISGLTSLEKVEQNEDTAGNRDMDAKSGRETVILAHHQADVSVTEEGFAAYVDIGPFEDAVPINIPNYVTNNVEHSSAAPDREARPTTFTNSALETNIIAETACDVSGLTSLEKVEPSEVTAGNEYAGSGDGSEIVVLAQQADGYITKEGFNAHVERPVEDAIIVHMDTLNEATETGKDSSTAVAAEVMPTAIANNALEAAGAASPGIGENISESVRRVEAVAKLGDSSILLLSKKAKKARQKALKLMDAVLSEQDSKSGRKTMVSTLNPKPNTLKVHTGAKAVDRFKEKPGTLAATRQPSMVTENMTQIVSSEDVGTKEDPGPKKMKVNDIFDMLMGN